MKKITILLLLFSISTINSQIKGKITDTKNTPLAVVSVYLDDTITGTTSNEDGYYELSIKREGNYTVVFQLLGFKSLRKTITVNSFPFELNAQLEEESVTLNEVNINTNENFANKIIRKVIANKKKNQHKTLQFTADFYSRGFYKIKNAPKKILGQSLGDLGGGLDSTRSGIVYLSETFSKISYQKPNKFKEHIVASKVSGSDNGVSFNRAEDVNFNLYKNTVEIGNQIVSPIANYAFNYYNYKLVGSFYDKNNRLINKIKIQPKRKNDRVFSGFIYVVEDEWVLYGTDVSVTGIQANLPMVEKLHFKQSFNKSIKKNTWVIISQSIEFKIGMFGIHMDGKFSAAYTNYNFSPNFTQDTFGKEILSFQKNATKKDSTYWNTLRPIPLTEEEVKDYVVKDSLKIVKKSKKYLDSIDAKNNKLSWSFPLSGYSYQNSYKKWSFAINSLIEDLSFNTVQGWNSSLGISHFKSLNETGKWMRFKTNINYGFSDKQLRPTIGFTYKWDNITRPILKISGGKTTAQFNSQNPISKIHNTVMSIFREENYLKIYEKTFAKVSFSKDLLNGIKFNSSLEFSDRKPLINTTNYSAKNVNDREYISNNPRNATDFSPSFNQHSIWLLNLGTSINFGTKYLSYPNRKTTIYSPKYPSIYVGYKKTFGANNSENHSDLLYTKINQNFSLGDLGNSAYSFNAGYFLTKKNISFIDYAHFNGNRVFYPSTKGRMNSFYLLNYYTHSTNDKYAEFHGEHHFKGFLLGKIPLINKLNFHLVGNVNMLATPHKKTYTEASIGLDNIGWGKWRFLRIDYVMANGGGANQKQKGLLFSIGLFN